jgi:tetratricopeptide (TPR) repeat protein
MIALIFLLALLSPVFAAEVLTNDAVVAMVKGGLAEEVIIGKIHISEAKYDLSADGLFKLKSDGVSDAILRAMIEASAPPSAAKAPDAVAKGTEAAVALCRQGKGGEAVAAFDKLLMDRPGDEALKIWKARALLEQARALKDVNASGYKPLVVEAYRILQPMGRARVADPDWNFAMAQAFWLNDRPTWAGKAASKALELRADFAEAQLVVGDLSFDSERTAIDSSPNDPYRQSARRFAGEFSRKEYQKVLAMREVPPSLRAETFYKLGLVALELQGQKPAARDFWERAVAADPNCRYGALAQQRLATLGGK